MGGIAIAIFLLIAPAHANSKHVLYNWPPQARPPLNASIETVTFDGMTFQQLVLRGEGLELTMPPLNNWKQTDATAHESIKFSYSNLNTLTLSFSLFKENTFLPNLEDNTLTGYIAGLQSQKPDQIQILNEGNYSPYKSFPIAGTNYKLVEYEIKDPEQGILLARDYLLFLDDILMIIHIEGPANAVRRIYPTIDASLQQSFVGE